MDKVRQKLAGIVAAFLVLVACAAARADTFTVDITVDENGHGHFANSAGFVADLPGVLAPDSGPGGANAALSYDLLNPPGLMSGDVVLMEGNNVSDLIRFNYIIDRGVGTLVFYSDITDGVDSLADMRLPEVHYTNLLVLLENGPEAGPNGIDYTPTQGQPGFVAGAAGPVTYHIISDPAPTNPIPLPASVWGGLAMMGVMGARRVFRSKRVAE